MAQRAGVLFFVGLLAVASLAAASPGPVQVLGPAEPGRPYSERATLLQDAVGHGFDLWYARDVNGSTVHTSFDADRLRLTLNVTNPAGPGFLLTLPATMQSERRSDCSSCMSPETDAERQEREGRANHSVIEVEDASAGQTVLVALEDLPRGAMLSAGGRVVLFGPPGTFGNGTTKEAAAAVLSALGLPVPAGEFTSGRTSGPLRPFTADRGPSVEVPCACQVGILGDDLVPQVNVVVGTWNEQGSLVRLEIWPHIAYDTGRVLDNATVERRATERVDGTWDRIWIDEPSRLAFDATRPTLVWHVSLSMKNETVWRSGTMQLDAFTGEVWDGPVATAEPEPSPVDTDADTGWTPMPFWLAVVALAGVAWATRHRGRRST